MNTKQTLTIDRINDLISHIQNKEQYQLTNEEQLDLLNLAKAVHSVSAEFTRVFNHTIISNFRLSKLLLSWNPKSYKHESSTNYRVDTW